MLLTTWWWQYFYRQNNDFRRGRIDHLHLQKRKLDICISSRDKEWLATDHGEALPWEQMLSKQ